MPEKPKLTFQSHKARWFDCENCELYKCRNKVVLLRGCVPCDVLFIGEAPGASEDVLGSPFRGPAGHLLGKIIAEGFLENPSSYALTNLVACIPIEGGNKIYEPSKACIKACSSRLEEVIDLCQTSAIVAVGKLAAKVLKADYDVPFFQEIVHPAAILRMDITQQGLAIQRSMVILSDLAEDLVEEKENR